MPSPLPSPRGRGDDKKGYFVPFYSIDVMNSAFAGLCFAVFFTVAGEGADATLTANEHPWGRFQPNTWCIVQTVTVSNVGGRAVQSLQTMRTTLKSIDETGITLEQAETSELGGRVVERQPQTIKVDFFQEPIQENVHISQGPPAKLMINKRVVPCAVRIYEQQTSSGHLTTTVWYTPHVYPHVLRVERVLRSSANGDGAGSQIIRQSVTVVQETSALRGIRSNRRNRTYSLQTIETVGNITKITDARCSWDVPGGLLESTTREFDAQNREIRRSASRMTNYSLHEATPVGLPQRSNRTRVLVETMNYHPGG